jgi:hypothetical protein
MPARADTPRRRRPTVAALSVYAVAAGVTLATAAGSAARPVEMARPSPPTVQPHGGGPFTPVQGDWEGTANGFAASFALVLDATRHQAAGVPQYGIQDLVMLQPLTCPPSPVHYSESILNGRLPSPLGPHGSLGLSRFGLQGALTGARSATLSGRYTRPGCHGTMTWHLHPAVRGTVADGTWTIHYADGEHSTFHVMGGGRLATSIQLPHSLVACNGLQGKLDVFIGARGGAAISEDGMTLKLGFANARATGSLAAQGCAGGPARVTALRTGG